MDRVTTGALDHRATFQSPIKSRGADGQIVQGWRDRFDAAAAVHYLRGGESAMQARLASKMPAILTILSCEAARQVTSEWRAVVRDRSGMTRIFEMKEDPRPAGRGALLEMLVEAT